MEVYKAINAVQADLAAVGISKSRQNKQQGYAFRGIDEIYNVLAPLLAKHCLVILPRVLTRECVERKSQAGGALFNVNVHTEFDFVSSKDGSKHTASTRGEAMDSADKATNKAMSAAYKYLCLQAFCIPTEGDNDADATTHEVAPEAPPPDPAAVALAEQINTADRDMAIKLWKASAGNHPKPFVREVWAALTETSRDILSELKEKKQ